MTDEELKNAIYSYTFGILTGYKRKTHLIWKDTNQEMCSVGHRINKYGSFAINYKFWNVADRTSEIIDLQQICKFCLLGMKTEKVVARILKHD